MVVHQKTEVTIHDKYYRELSIWKQLSASYRTYMRCTRQLLQALSIRWWDCWNVASAYGRHNSPGMLKWSCLFIFNDMLSTDDEIEDTLIPTKEIYYSSSVAFVPANYRPPMIRDWQDLSTHWAKVYPAIFMGEERFQYYYVVPDHHIIAWLEDMDGHILFGECVNPSKWRHKRLELEAQFGECEMHKERNGLLSWSYNQNNRFKNRSSDFKSIRRRFNVLDVRPDESSCRSTGQYQYASLHSPTSFIGNAAAVVLCVPVTIEHIQTTSVDGIVNGVEVRRFVNDFSSQAKSQITLTSTSHSALQAGVSMALDIAILAIPGNMVQHFGERMESLDFAVQFTSRFCILTLTLPTRHITFVRRKMMLIIITCIPTFFCVLRLVSVGVGGPRVRKEQKVPQGAIPKGLVSQNEAYSTAYEYIDHAIH
ncbi:hypothetical protein F4604DRAFT_1674179 [Suillus subluteus]|nr:hypothetical protein F4604DRAFT_1674179 [Suillus subluteus]